MKIEQECLAQQGRSDEQWRCTHQQNQHEKLEWESYTGCGSWWQIAGKWKEIDLERTSDKSK
jgi:hypothetical protein